MGDTPKDTMMSYSWAKYLVPLLLAGCATTAAAGATRTILVTGATGRTGSLVYNALQKLPGVTVRALIRNATKAKSVLHCDNCDPSEGIWVGDVTDPTSDGLAAALTGADSLVITTGPAFHCTLPKIYIGCKFYPGADPKTMSWLAVKNQVAVFANSTGPALGDRHVVLLSNDMTTTPDNFLDKVGNGHGCFYSLNGEAFTMNSGMQFTIIKPNGLGDGEPGEQQIVVAHDDAGWSPSDPNYEFIARSDVARMLTYAVSNPSKTTGLRFDVTSNKAGTKPTKDVSELFAQAMYPWDPRAV